MERLHQSGVSPSELQTFTIIDVLGSNLFRLMLRRDSEMIITQISILNMHLEMKIFLLILPGSESTLHLYSNIDK